MYEQYIKEIGEYFEENRFKFLVYKVSEGIHDLLTNSHKKIEINRSRITLILRNKDKYISYELYAYAHEESNIDTNVGKLSDYKFLYVLMPEIAKDLQLLKVKENLEMARKCEESVLAFSSYFKVPLLFISLSFTPYNVLIIKNKEDKAYCVVPSKNKDDEGLIGPLKEEIKRLELIGELLRYEDFLFVPYNEQNSK